MRKTILEYIWLDGDTPQKLRSKTKVMDRAEYINGVDEIPEWNYDGSSTNQATTENSEIILKPVNFRYDPFKHTFDKNENNYYIVLCETFLPNGEPHSTNNRSVLRNLVDNIARSKNTMYGFEQEYTMVNKKTGKPLGWPDGFPKPQGDYYCGVGANHVSGREITEKHLELCLAAGIQLSGVNAEVMLGQWEYQVGPVGPLDGSDQLWFSRYILYKLGEQYGVEMNIDPKPIGGNEWNGSGMHVNFSTGEMRNGENIISGKSRELIEQACEKLEKTHKEHILVYGENNDKRMTGKNETSDINKFSWGYGSRTTSIRIPMGVKDKKVGYLEDRRPASNADPYLVVYKLISTIMN